VRVVAGILISLGAQCCATTKAFAQLQDFDRAVKSVVRIYGSQCSDGGHAGSGYIRTSRTIVTSFHVVAGCQRISVEFADAGQGQFSVTRIRFDKSRDLAELEVGEKIPGLVLSGFSENTSTGEKLFVVGYPEQIRKAEALPVEVLAGTASAGTLGQFLPEHLQKSALSIGLDLTTRIIRVTTGIPPGASGSPVLRASGELVGIATGRGEVRC
jgi:S1-C subfamily serine protease